jgi:hypothetical protein
MSDILEISCDEAGHTGPDLLQKDQQVFAFSSVAISDTEAFEIIRKVRVDYPVQMPELKASKLLASERGRKLIAAIFAAIEGRYAINAHDKLLALCGWFFEYIYEPVYPIYRDEPGLLYAKNLHRFVAMYTYLWMSDPTSEARRAIEEFQNYMRTRDPADAPFLFNTPRPPLTDNGSEHPFESVLRFAYGYRDIIIADNGYINTMTADSGRWALHLSTSALFSHLNHWGRTGKLLSVRCDISKPLEAAAKKFKGDDNDPSIRRARGLHKAKGVGYKLAEPITFVDSRDHPAVQIADVVAGTAFALFAHGLPSCDSSIAESIARHGLGDSILPDTDIIDPANRSAAVNALILYDLAKRAERHGDPYENLQAMYHLAEVSWARGDLERIKAGLKPGGAPAH